MSGLKAKAAWSAAIGGVSAIAVFLSTWNLDTDSDAAGLFTAALRLFHESRLGLGLDNPLTMAFNFSHGPFLLLLPGLSYGFTNGVLGLPFSELLLHLPWLLSGLATTAAAAALAHICLANRRVTFWTFALVASMPVHIGVTRIHHQFVLLTLLLALICVHRSASSGSPGWRRAAVLLSGVLVGIDNAFVVSGSLVLAWIFLLAEGGAAERAKRTLLFFRTPWTLFPAGMLCALVAMYFVEARLGIPVGFLRYSQGKGAHFVFAWREVGSGALVCFGIPFSAAVPFALALTFRSGGGEPRLKAFLAVWLAAYGFFLFFLHPLRGLEMIYLAWVMVPLVMAAALMLEGLTRWRPWAGIALGTLLVAGTLLHSFSLVLGVPFVRPQLRGAAVDFDRGVRAAGYLIRKNGPETILTSHGDYESGTDRNYATDLYWGRFHHYLHRRDSDGGFVFHDFVDEVADPGYEYVVVFSRLTGQRRTRDILEYAERRGYCAKYAILDGTSGVARIYAKTPTCAPPQEFQAADLNASWVREFGSIRHLTSRSLGVR